MGSAVMPDASVSSVTAMAPSSSPTTQVRMETPIILPMDAECFMRGLKSNG